jgi:cation transporter-like permease
MMILIVFAAGTLLGGLLVAVGYGMAQAGWQKTIDPDEINKAERALPEDVRE